MDKEMNTKQRLYEKSLKTYVYGHGHEFGYGYHDSHHVNKESNSF